LSHAGLEARGANFRPFDRNRSLAARNRSASRVVEGFFQTGLEFGEQLAHGFDLLSANLSSWTMRATPSSRAKRGDPEIVTLADLRRKRNLCMLKQNPHRGRATPD
jgi:hypothetical protein